MNLNESKSEVKESIKEENQDSYGVEFDEWKSNVLSAMKNGDSKDLMWQTVILLHKHMEQRHDPRQALADTWWLVLDMGAEMSGLTWAEIICRGVSQSEIGK